MLVHPTVPATSVTELIQLAKSRPGKINFGYVVEPWWGILAPAGTPKTIVTRLSTEIAGIVKTRQMKETFAQHGAEPIGDTPAQFAELINAEIKKWAKVAKEAGVQVE